MQCRSSTFESDEKVKDDNSRKLVAISSYDSKTVGSSSISMASTTGTHHSTISARCTTATSAAGNGSSTGRTTNTGRIIMPSLVRNDNQIRNRYLQKLGVVPLPGQGAAASTPPSAATTCQNEGTLPRPQFICPEKFNYQQKLKECKVHGNKFSRMISPQDVASFEEQLIPSRRRAVSFDSTVNVRVIPHKNMYSKKIKSSLWSSPDELEQNARRNAFEFESEGRDWNRAIEDERFLTCPQTGRQIHPAHVHWLDHFTRRLQQPKHLQRRLWRLLSNPLSEPNLRSMFNHNFIYPTYMFIFENH